MRESATTSLADTRSRPVPIRYQSRQKNNHRIDRRGQHTTAARHESLYLESNRILGVWGAAKIDCSMPKQQRSTTLASNRVVWDCA
jgi:hypothetical protein